jgi:hypothetical protein
MYRSAVCGHVWNRERSGNGPCRFEGQEHEGTSTVEADAAASRSLHSVPRCSQWRVKGRALGEPRCRAALLMCCRSHSAVKSLLPF